MGLTIGGGWEGTQVSIGGELAVIEMLLVLSLLVLSFFDDFDIALILSDDPQSRLPRLSLKKQPAHLASDGPKYFLASVSAGVRPP